MTDPGFISPDGPVDAKTLLHLVERLYEAVADPAEWRTFLDALTEATDGAYARLWRCDGDPTLKELIVSDVRAYEWARDYNAYYHQVNPSRALLDRFYPGAANSYANFLGDPGYRRTEYWDGLHRASGIDDEIGIVGLIAPEELRVFAISVVNELGRGRFSEEHERLCAALGKHVATAARLVAHSPNGFGVSLPTTIESIQSASMVLDERARLVQANVRALGLMRAGLVRLDDEGRPTVGTSDATRALHHAVAAAIATAAGESLAPGRSLAVDSPVGRLRLFVAPLVSRLPSGAPRRGALLFVSGGEGAEALAKLSPAQRAVAERVAVGATAEETARDLGISTETVRSHVKAIYRKLGIASRIELVRLLNEG